MREMKCRAWTVETKKEVKGYYCQVEGKHYIIPNTATMYREKDDDYSGVCLHTYSYHLSGFVEVIPETVGQFTGLHDKNSKEIYEGDILKHNPEDDDWDDLVVWWPKKARFELQSYVKAYESVKQKDAMSIYSINATMLKLADWVQGSSNPSIVIGNIHENPELLENKK